MTRRALSPKTTMPQPHPTTPKKTAPGGGDAVVAVAVAVAVVRTEAAHPTEMSHSTMRDRTSATAPQNPARWLKRPAKKRKPATNPVGAAAAGGEAAAHGETVRLRLTAAPPAKRKNLTAWKLASFDPTKTKIRRSLSTPRLVSCWKPLTPTKMESLGESVADADAEAVVVAQRAERMPR